MKRRWLKAAGAAGILLFCAVSPPQINWKESIISFKTFHEEKLIAVNQSIDDAIDMVKAMLKQEAEEEEPETAESDAYSRFGELLFATAGYSASGVERIRTEAGDWTYDFELSVSGEDCALREIAGEDNVRTVLLAGILYTINETEATASLDRSGDFANILEDACRGKVISARENTLNGTPVMEYEIYQNEIIYKMSFDANDELKCLRKLSGSTLIEFLYSDFDWGITDETLLTVDMDAYETVRESYLRNLSEASEVILTLPPEYPPEGLPIPEYSTLTAVKVNFDADKNGSMMITYVCDKTTEELKQYYIDCLRGTDNYIVGEELRSGEVVTVLSGTVGDWTVELVEIRYNKVREKMQVNLLLTKQS